MRIRGLSDCVFFLNHQAADQSFDTTTNLRGNKVNIPTAAPQNPFDVVKQPSVDSARGSAGRASTGSAGGPQYA